jgi:hypothetical protein
MGDRTPRRHRVIIEDARHNGHYLRITWHPERRQFVVSTWRDDVCTGAAQLSAADGAEVAALLVEGLADAATTPVPAPATGAGPGEGGAALADRAAAAIARLRAWWRRSTAPATPLPPPVSGPPEDAPVHTRRSA